MLLWPAGAGSKVGTGLAVPHALHFSLVPALSLSSVQTAQFQWAAAVAPPLVADPPFCDMAVCVLRGPTGDGLQWRQHCSNNRTLLGAQLYGADAVKTTAGHAFRSYGHAFTLSTLAWEGNAC